jgi:protocatechuate 3,4-dioxygenase alpha subunit
MTALGRTPSQTVGPFFAIGLVRDVQNELVRGGDLRIVGRVLDGAGDPVPDAVVELWQRGADGTLWGRCGTDAHGRFEFVTEAPLDGYADVIVFARGLLRHLVTRCYLPGASDAVLEALDPADRETLVAQPQDGALRFDVRLQGERQTVFFAL